MNCTAFGLSVAIPALVAFSVLQGRTQVMMDELNESTVGLMNLILANRDKMKLAVAAPVDDEDDGAEAEA
jgi:biopolymer transport protein ExbB